MPAALFRRAKCKAAVALFFASFSKQQADFPCHSSAGAQWLAILLKKYTACMGTSILKLKAIATDSCFDGHADFLGVAYLRKDPQFCIETALEMSCKANGGSGKPRRGEVVKWVCVASNPEHTQRTAAHSSAQQHGSPYRIFSAPPPQWGDWI